MTDVEHQLIELLCERVSESKHRIALNTAMDAIAELEHPSAQEVECLTRLRHLKAGHRART